MNIIIFSDSHAETKYMLKALKHFENKIDAIIHLGDYIDDVKIIKSKFPKIDLYAIAGNNDYCNVPSEKFFKLNKYNFFITHGHNYNPYNGISTLHYKASELGANVVLYGHTHTPYIFNEDILIINPGSISFPRKIPHKTFLTMHLGEDITYKLYAINDISIMELNT